jgi:hypothetical protein
MTATRQSSRSSSSWRIARIFTAPQAGYTRKLLADTPSIEAALGQAPGPISA